MPDILADLAEVEMHAIQTSGNCIRNVTADHFAGAAADEIDDPRSYAEIIRQWSTFHPEFTFLPRKFKIAVTGAAARSRGDPGARHRPAGRSERRRARSASRSIVGGGLGRTPMIAPTIRDFLPEPRSAVAICEAILRVYNRYGRRDNKYKARIKILVHEIGAGRVHAPGRGRIGADRRTAR